MRLVDFPVERPIATTMFLLSLMVLGAVSLFRLPLDFMPIVDEPEIDIEVTVPGAHPLEALREVAMVIEEEVATIPGVRWLRSRADVGSAEVEVGFDWSVDIQLEKMAVLDAVERARPRLPATVGRITVEGDTDGPGANIIEGRISAVRDLSESWDLLDRRIRRPLERVRGVAKVGLYGVEPQQVRIDLDLDALTRYGIDAGEVSRRLDAENIDLDLGSIRGRVISHDIRVEARFDDLSTLKRLNLGDGVRLGDVAEISLSEPRLTYGRHLDRNFAIAIEVVKEPTANTVETVDRVLARLEEIRGDPELEGIEVLVWENAAEEIINSLVGLRNAGMIGGALAIFVLFLFLRHWRTTVIVGIAIPFSLLVTTGGMYLLGAPLDVLTMLGLMLGVGMLVDNAVVVIENIHRLQGRGVKQAAIEGVREVFMPVLASTATTIVVWSWLLVSERNTMAIMMGEVALTICLAVTSSLLISLTFIPMAAAHAGSSDAHGEGFVMRRLIPAYARAVGFSEKWRWLFIVPLIGICIAAVHPFSAIEKEGEPRIIRPFVAVAYEVHDPSDKETLESYVDVVEEWLAARKDELAYESIYSWYAEHGGTQTRLYLPKGSVNEAAVAALESKLEAGLPEIPGVTLRIGVRDWYRHRGGDRMRTAVALHGDDPEFLEELARRVEKHLQGTEGVSEVWGPSLSGRKEALVRIDPDVARDLGVTPELVAGAVSFAFRGRRLERFQGERGEIEMVLGLPEDAQPGLASLEELPLPRPDGVQIPLASVATIEHSRVPQRIRREDRRTTSWITLNFDRATKASVGKENVRRRMETFSFPDGYTWDFGRRGRDRTEALDQMMLGVAMALVVVVLLMAALFESLMQPVVILISVVMAFFGAFWLLWLLGMTFDIVAAMGTIILIGLVVNNGIVMVDRINTLRRERGLSRRAALVEGCSDRLRPVLMTTMTTLFGLVPLAYSGFAIDGAQIDSIAYVLIGGLSFSAAFTLLALPLWYAVLDDLAIFLVNLLPQRRPGRMPSFSGHPPLMQKTDAPRAR